MAFHRGQTVEISLKEEGFLGSYYVATVLSPLKENDYMIEYRTLLSDDKSRLLREIVNGVHVRPSPPEIPVSGFSLHDSVDAYDNDGWWVGRITAKSGSKYSVYFESTGDEVRYPISQLRVHQEWEDAKWVIFRKRV